MKRDEALDLIGQPVWAWTALHGSYRGILREVVGRPGRPWRAKVEITGQCESAFRDKRAYSPGTMIEVGHTSIGPLNEKAGE